ncbi:MAG: hypothetical protein WCT20_04450, partial [Candidatus Babeliales bacterium]
MVSIRSLFLIGCIFGAFNLALAKTYTQKTFLMPRSPGQNLAFESTSWHRLIYPAVKSEQKWHLQWGDIYQASVHGKELGKYFGIGNGSNSFIVGPEPLIGTTNDSEVYSDYIIHDYAVISDAETVHPLTGIVSFSPKQEILGDRLDVIGEFCDCCYIKASLPVVSVRNTMRMRITSQQPAQMKNGSGTVTAEYSLSDYFKGGVDVCQAMDDADLQVPLTHAKIDGGRRYTGLSDLDVQFGYKCYHTEAAHVFLNLGVTLPTSNKPKGKWLFEPLTGNGAHAGLGFGFDTGARLWEKGSSDLTLMAFANYRYLFEGTEHRTLSLKPDNFSAVMDRPVLLHYALLAQNGAAAYTPLIPAANLLTQKLAVKPGNSLDAVLDLSLKSGQFVIDLGYNLFYKDKESIKLKHGTWQDNVYGIAASDVDTSAGITLSQLVNNHLITTADFDVNAAKTPAYLTNKIFGGLGYTYTFNDKYPCLFGMGA